MRLRMLALLVIVAAITAAGADGPDGPDGFDGFDGFNDDPPEPLIGAWAHNHIFYRFEDDGRMELAVIADSMLYRRYFTYRSRRFDTHTLLLCEDTGAKQSSSRLLFFSEVSDTSAVIAAGPEFVRADSSEGLTGSWRHSSGFGVIELSLDAETLGYRETEFDPATGFTRIVEQRQGLYTTGAGDDYGRFLVRFDDGKTGTLFPFLVEDILYLFDLVPRKSLFLRAEYDENFPVYRAEALGL